VKLVSPIGGDTGGSGNLSGNLSNVAGLATHPKFVWFSTPTAMGRMIYNNPVFVQFLVNLLKYEYRKKPFVSLNYRKSKYQIQILLCSIAGNKTVTSGRNQRPQMSRVRYSKGVFTDKQQLNLIDD
jgi:hypothetical protein